MAGGNVRLVGQGELRQVETATIANGESLSGALDLTPNTVVAIQMSAGWTAADLTFLGSADGVTYGNIRDDTKTEVTVQVEAAGDYIVLEPSEWVSTRYLKVRSGTAALPVSQGAERVLTLVVRPV